jgi:hypothetical protein
LPGLHHAGPTLANLIESLPSGGAPAITQIAAQAVDTTPVDHGPALHLLAASFAHDAAGFIHHQHLAPAHV